MAYSWSASSARRSEHLLPNAMQSPATVPKVHHPEVPEMLCLFVGSLLGCVFSEHRRRSKAARAGYPSDVRDEEWEFVLPCLLLCREDAAQQRHDLRLVFTGAMWRARVGSGVLPHEYGPWWAMYQQMRRWLEAGVFEVLVTDVQAIVREWEGRKGQPTAVCLDSRTLQSTRAGRRVRSRGSGW